jgi:hypothetical protein
MTEEKIPEPKYVNVHADIIQLFIYLRAELNSRWPIAESARNLKQTIQ